MDGLAPGGEVTRLQMATRPTGSAARLQKENFMSVTRHINITVKLPCELPRSLLIIFSLIDITRRVPGRAYDTDNLIKIYGTVFEKIDIITFPHVNPMGNSGVNYPKVG